MSLCFEKLCFNRLDLLYDTERKPTHSPILRASDPVVLTYPKACGAPFQRNPLDHVTLLRVVSNTRVLRATIP